jgi:hypothetical protein
MWSDVLGISDCALAREMLLYRNRINGVEVPMRHKQQWGTDDVHAPCSSFPRTFQARLADMLQRVSLSLHQTDIRADDHVFTGYSLHEGHDEQIWGISTLTKRNHRALFVVEGIIYSLLSYM